MVDPIKSATVVAVSAIALVILIGAVRKTFTRGEWDGAALFGSMSVLAVNFGNFLVAYLGDYSVIHSHFQVAELLVPDWARLPIRLANATLAVAVVAIFLQGARRDTKLNYAAVLFLLVALTSNISTILHGDSAMQTSAMIFLAILIACTVAPRGLGSPVGIGTGAMIVAVASGLTMAVRPHFSVLPCTDKCGVWGFLFRGMEVHENTLAMLLALAIPFVYLAFESWEGPVLCTYLLGLALITGSRSGGAAALVTLVVLLLVRPSVRRPRSTPASTALVYLLLLGTSVIGMALPFYTDDPTTLSGRGQLWLLARQELGDTANLLHGTGMLGWEQVIQSTSLTNFYSPHNQWLHVLSSTGLVGLLVFVAAFAALVRQSGRQYSLVIGCVLLPVFIMSVTERPWPIDRTDILTWVVIGALLSCPAAGRFSNAGVTPAAGVPGDLVGISQASLTLRLSADRGEMAAHAGNDLPSPGPEYG